MEPEYSGEKIEIVTRKLKNKKAFGRDKVIAEVIKHVCNEFYEQIASLYNANIQKISGDVFYTL